MTHKRLSIYLLLALAWAAPALSQEDASLPEKIRPLIFDSLLSAPDTSAPLVTIRQDARIENAIQNKIQGTQERITERIQGFRVQVYSSNAPKTAKEEAFLAEKKVTQEFSTLKVYVLYQPPFWKVRVGNFRTQAEADILREELLKAFPAMQGDIYIVKDVIEVAGN